MLPVTYPGVHTADVDQKGQQLTPPDVGLPGYRVIRPELVGPINTSHVFLISDDLPRCRDGVLHLPLQAVDAEASEKFISVTFVLSAICEMSS